MLNTLLASYITANDSYGNPYDKWVKEITENTAEFMKQNLLALAKAARFVVRAPVCDELNIKIFFILKHRNRLLQLRNLGEILRLLALDNRESFLQR